MRRKGRKRSEDKMLMRFTMGLFLTFLGWWAALDGAKDFPQIIDPNNQIAGIALPHHWFIGFIFIVIGLGIMIREVLR